MVAVGGQQQKHRSLLSSRSKQGVSTSLMAVAVGAITLLGALAVVYLYSLRRILVVEPNNNNNLLPLGANVDPALENSFQQPANGIGGTLLLTTQLGVIKMQLRPDLSPESCQYIRQLAALSQTSPCPKCHFYRAEKPGILQGVMAHTPPLNAHEMITRGACPNDVAEVTNNCPPWDRTCGCHGPIMTRGMVGWAGGATGPDFFIDAYLQPAKFWGTQHTVFAEIKDDASFAIIDQIWELPVNKGGMTLLKENLNFTLKIV